MPLPSFTKLSTMLGLFFWLIKFLANPLKAFKFCIEVVIWFLFQCKEDFPFAGRAPQCCACETCPNKGGAWIKKVCFGYPVSILFVYLCLLSISMDFIWYLTQMHNKMANDVSLSVLQRSSCYCQKPDIFWSMGAHRGQSFSINVAKTFKGVSVKLLATLT